MAARVSSHYGHHHCLQVPTALVAAAAGRLRPLVALVRELHHVLHHRRASWVVSGDDRAVPAIAPAPTASGLRAAVREGVGLVVVPATREALFLRALRVAADVAARRRPRRLEARIPRALLVAADVAARPRLEARIPRPLLVATGRRPPRREARIPRVLLVAADVAAGRHHADVAAVPRPRPPEALFFGTLFVAAEIAARRRPPLVEARIPRVLRVAAAGRRVPSRGRRPPRRREAIPLVALLPPRGRRPRARLRAHLTAAVGVVVVVVALVREGAPDLLLLDAGLRPRDARPTPLRRRVPGRVRREPVGRAGTRRSSTTT